MSISAETRDHALDAVRAFALLLGVVLHATMSFFLPIPAQDSSQSTTLALAFYVIHTFRMSVFFLIAGYFGHLLLQRHGTRGFIADRARRIVVPMTVGWLLLAPIIIAIIVVGLSRNLPAGTASGAAAPTAHGFPLAHLWFLYYLCLFYAVALALRSLLVSRFDRDSRMRARIDVLVKSALRHRLAPLLIGAPTAVVLYATPSWPVWFGIPTPDTGLVPQLPATLAFGAAFAFGWLLHRQRDLLAIWRAQWLANLVLALALTAGCLMLVGLTPPADATTIAGAPWRRVVYAAVYATSIGFWVSGLIGAALRFCAAASATRRYLADASYWFYLAHLPIVFGLQVLVMDWPLHWSVKFPMIVAVTFALLFASYHWLVRSSFIGEVLNGRRHPPATTRADAGARAPDDTALLPTDDGAIAQLASVSKRYGSTHALNGINFAVQPGELVALLGPNGAGKSSAIGLLLGILESDAGEVRLDGGSPFDAQRRLGIGVMMQDVQLNPTLSARELVALTTSYYREPMGIDETIALSGIDAFARKRYGTLSGGQKRQVQFALAICGRPQLLFLDEPTVGLDQQARASMWQTIGRMRDQGCAVVLTTHYLDEAEALADRVVFLAHGKIIAEGSVEQMRALVTCKQIRCSSVVQPEQIRRWPGVVDVVRDTRGVHITASDAEVVVRLLFVADPALSQLEVEQATLAEAFNRLTKEAA